MIAGTNTGHRERAMHSILAAFRNYWRYLTHLSRRRAKAAADRDSDPFIYPHS
jgi:hypothetical protein